MDDDRQNQALKVQKQNADLAAASRLAQAQQQAGQLYGQGDTRGSQAAMISGGVDPSMITATTGADKQSFDERQTGLKTIMSNANWLNGELQAGRMSPQDVSTYVAHNAPLYLAAGAHPDDINDVVQNPQLVGSVASMGMTGAEQDAAKVAQQNADNGTTTAQTGQYTAQTGRMAELRAQNTPVGISTEDNVYLPGGAQMGAAGSAGAPSGDTYSRMIGAESAGHQFDKNGAPLVSSKGAVGIGQLMPAAAQDAARLLGVAYDPQRLATDASYNRQLGQAYFTALKSRYGGDEVKAVAAYNAGPGRVDQAIAQAGGNWMSIMPAETKAYVAKVQPGQAAPTAQAGSQINGPTLLAAGVPKATGGAAASVEAPGDASLTGPAYLADLQRRNPSLAGRIQAVLDTKAPFPKAVGSRNPVDAQVAAGVYQVDPSFDQAAWKKRNDTIREYTMAGNTGKTLNSAANIINHLYDFARSADNIHDGYSRLSNDAVNLYRSQTNDPNLITYNEGRKFVSTELPKFLTGKPPAEGEIKQNYDSYDPRIGASGAKTAIGTDLDYMIGKFQPLIDSYKAGVGKDFNIDDLQPGSHVSEKLAALQRWRSGGSLDVAPTAQAQAHPQPAAPRAAPAVGQTVMRNGASYTWTGSGWVKHA